MSKTILELFEQASMSVPAKLHGLSRFAQENQMNLHIFDVEHSGYVAGGGGAGLIEMASVLIEKTGKIRGLRQFVNPECEITFFARKTHGYSQAQVKKFPSWKHLGAAFTDIMKASVNIGYNVPSDLSVIRKQNERYGLEVPNFAQMDLFKVWVEHAAEKKGKLGEVSAVFGLDASKNSHKAWDDTLLTAQLMEAMLETPKFRATIEQFVKYVDQKNLNHSLPSFS